MTSWILFPLVLGALCVGWGLLAGSLVRLRLPGALLPGLGMACVVVVGQFLVVLDATAELATPVIAAGGLAGLALGLIRRVGRPPAWAVLAAVAVFGVYGAPIVFSGEATFAGFIRLDDTATWMALTDRVMEHGRSLDGLAPSTYEATLSFNLGAGYPVGAFVPLGVGAALVGEDVAWVIQPYMALWAALLALALWRLAGGLVEDARARAAVAFVAAQPALLYGYYLWGGIKEVAAIALIATLAALLRLAVSKGSHRRALPAALAAAALLGVLSGGGAVWLAPLLAGVAVVGTGRLGDAQLAGRALFFGAAAALLSLPVFLTGGLLPPTSSPLTAGDAIGNLAGPLDPLQIGGIWPAGDFRLEPAHTELAYVLVLAAAGAALVGLLAAASRGAWQIVAFSCGTLAAALGIALVGSPWVEGKALATASVVIPFAALLGACVLWGSGRRAPAILAGALVVGGVAWSNALAYRDVSLAPRQQLAELEQIGTMIAGEGPTLMTEYNPYGARHFLREGDPEGISELRRRRIPLRDGTRVPKGLMADTDEVSPEALLLYRSLVLRRSPAQSRPPSPYEPVWRGEHYELWQRPAGVPDELRHHPLGGDLDPGGRPRCSRVRALASGVGPRGTLLAVPREPVLSLALGDSAFRVRADGEYEVWLRGPASSEVAVEIDGAPVGRARQALVNAGGYVHLGSVSLAAGSHAFAASDAGPGLRPGSGAPVGAGRAVVLSRAAAFDTRIERVPASRAARLCDGRYDWVEALPP